MRLSEILETGGEDYDEEIPEDESDWSNLQE